MKRIGIISDTHGYWDDKYLHYFEPCDEIWHAGDIGSVEVADRLSGFRPLRAVCGNCDGGDLRLLFHDVIRFKSNISAVIPATTTAAYARPFMLLRHSFSSAGTRTY